ncbi:MAG: hypothetical protein LBU51_10520 [Bacteroidales bacterium]|jgi:hypothetical protein|nr:hypothetical protein [Bacteroidales bacterium]
MKRIKILLFFAAVLLFGACNKDPVTYRFEKEDEAKLLPHYTVGKILTFRNELGEERKFEVSKSEKKIMQDWVNVGMGGVSDHYYFFYEIKNILLLDIFLQEEFGIHFKQYPIDQEKARKNIHRKYESHLKGGIDDVFFDFEKKYVSRNVNGVNYNEVIELHGTDFSPLFLFHNVNVLYYDIYHGIIEFQDMNNHHWELINR